MRRYCDPSTRCHERTSLEDIFFQPYSDPLHRLERDLIYGTSYDDFEAYTPDASASISRSRFDEAYNAVRYANFLMYTLNVQLTINWEQAGYDCPTSVDNAFQAFSDRFRKFTMSRKLPALYYAVFENGSKKGYHCHIGLHMPRKFIHEFQDWARSTVKAPDGGCPSTEVVHVTHNKEFAFTAQWKWFHYSMKGVDPALSKAERRAFDETTFHRAAGLYPSPYAGGLIEIDRVRVARPLGPKARRASGYGPDRQVLRMPKDNRYGDSGYADRVRYDLGKSIASYEVVPCGPHG